MQNDSGGVWERGGERLNRTKAEKEYGKEVETGRAERKR